jgi:hypothetical protein
MCQAVIVLGALMLVFVSAAWGDGGKTIATGPVVTPGQQESGDTSTVSPESHGNYHSWWNLSVTVGDYVTIDWGAPNFAAGTYPEIQVFPIDTSDYTYADATFSAYQGPFDDTRSSDYEVQSPSGNGLNRLDFTAGETGNVPFDFTTGPTNCCSSVSNAPYYFTVSVTHKAGTCTGSTWHRLLCDAAKLKTIVECGVEVAAFGPLKALRGIKIIKGLYDTRKVSGALRPVYQVYDDLMKLHLRNGLTGADLWRKLQKARTVKDLVNNLIDVGKLVTDTKGKSFTRFVRDFTDLIGVGACVHLVIGGT